MAAVLNGLGVKTAVNIDTAAQVTVVNTDVFTNLFGRDIAPKEELGSNVPELISIC